MLRTLLTDRNYQHPDFEWDKKKDIYLDELGLQVTTPEGQSSTKIIFSL